MKKHLSIGLSAFALAALLSGCGGGAEPPRHDDVGGAGHLGSRDVQRAGDVRAGVAGRRGPQGGANPRPGQIVVDGKG